MAEEEDPWRERGRAVLVGLILAFGVVAMVLLSGRTGGRRAAEAEWPAVAGIHDVVAACEGCGCEPEPAEGTLAVVHPGLPPGQPVPRLCEGPALCAAALERRGPAGVRGPMVHPPSTDPGLVARELGQGPALAPEGEGFQADVTRERRTDRCVRVRRTRELEPLPGGEWRWVERYESGEGDECPAPEALTCLAESRRTLRQRDPRGRR